MIEIPYKVTDITRRKEKYIESSSAGLRGVGVVDQSILTEKKSYVDANVCMHRIQDVHVLVYLCQLVDCQVAHIIMVQTIHGFDLTEKK